MDWLVMVIGVTIVLGAISVSYISGMRSGKAKVRTEYKDHISLRGLSPTAKDKLKGYVQIVHIWDAKRSPDRDKYKPVHYD